MRRLRSMLVKMKFKAKIRMEGINPYVDVPMDITRELRKKGFIYIKGYLNKIPIKGTLVPRKRRHILFINGEMRKEAGVGLGHNKSFIGD